MVRVMEETVYWLGEPIEKVLRKPRKAEWVKRQRVIDLMVPLVQHMLTPPQIDVDSLVRAHLDICYPDWRFDFAAEDRWKDDGGR